jgi:hypothetical protein
MNFGRVNKSFMRWQLAIAAPCVFLSMHLWISDAGNQSGREHWTDAGYIVEPPACFTGSVPSHDHTIELQDLCLQHP